MICDILPPRGTPCAAVPTVIEDSFSDPQEWLLLPVGGRTAVSMDKRRKKLDKSHLFVNVRMGKSF